MGWCGGELLGFRFETHPVKGDIPSAVSTVAAKVTLFDEPLEPKHSTGA